MSVIKRVLPIPKKSFMLFGPRGVGKSTWIRHQLPQALEIDLLEAKQFLPLNANPSLLQEMTRSLLAGDWVFIDEIQKVPALLDEVHSLYEKKRLHFALSGSSARKLRRGGANLLAGRALTTHMFPLTFQEYRSTASLQDALVWGSLPQVVTEPDFRQEYLYSYVQTYLREELVAEGIIRKLEPFLRALQVIGLYNGQILNVENIARESHVSRSSVDSYFGVLEDTLLGFRLYPLCPKWNAKENKHPKFYMFDVGVARACAGLLGEDLDSLWTGFSFETTIVNHVRAYNCYLQKHRDLFYYKFSDGYEVDLFIERKKKTLSSKQELVAIEIKASRHWDKRWNEPLLDLQAKSKGRIQSLVGVYQGKSRLEQSGVQIYPAEEFLLALHQGEFLS